MKKLIAACIAIAAFQAHANTEELNCENHDQIRHEVEFDLKEGNYKSSSTTEFCDSYTVKNVTQQSCTDNIKSFELTCVHSSAVNSLTFKCDDGVCLSEGDRVITLDEDFNDWAKYTKVKDGKTHKTILMFTGPC